MSAAEDAGHRPGDPIAGVFPSDECEARFMVAMAMARNDIDRGLRDSDRAASIDGPDFSYRVRLTFGHLVEAIDALNTYSQECPDIKKLLGRLPKEAQHALSTVRGTLQKVGPDVLEAVRHNTFHYPSPKAAYGDTNSDEQLCKVLASMSEELACSPRVLSA